MMDVAGEGCAVPPEDRLVVARAPGRTALERPSFVLEVTESLLADDPEAIIRQLRTLKQLGLRIAIDDFGTGYSAPSQLQDLPIGILKIDKAFIDRLDIENEKANLVQGIVDLGGSLHLDVIAEGIEQPQQADQLKAMRSPLGQGFLFSRPTGCDETLALLQTRSRLIAGER
jgi:EAL domain-containing protein (putative c-di-GMP-specific phosphodiesterase class I)